MERRSPRTRARDYAKAAKEEVFKIDGDYVAKKGHRRDNSAALPEQLRKQVDSAVAGSNELGAVHAKEKSQKAEAKSLAETLEVNRREVASIERVVKKQRS